MPPDRKPRGHPQPGEPATDVPTADERPIDEADATPHESGSPQSDDSPREPADGVSTSRSGNPVPEADVAAMFDDIAPVYDRMNTLMTLGFDGRWRRAALTAALALPASDGAFDAATIAFGLRNLPNFEAAFRELARVVRPGGWVVCLELSVPRPRIWGRIYHSAFRRSAPLLGSLFGRREAYRYLPQSLEGFPNPDELVRTMIRAGLVEVSYRQLGLGAVALHRGRVPR